MSRAFGECEAIRSGTSRSGRLTDASSSGLAASQREPYM